MIRLDLITGFLGAGKTTFIEKYVKELNRTGEKVAVIESDFGGVNVDMMLLNPLQGAGCITEQILADGDKTTYKRRLKAKLIALAMQGLKRVIVEPSGIFDMEDFLDILYEEPVDAWYELGNVIAIVDGNLSEKIESGISKESAYMMVSQIANAGILVFSKWNTGMDSAKQIAALNGLLEKGKCSRKLEEKECILKDWKDLTEEDYQKIVTCGYRQASYEKTWFDQKEQFGSLAFLETGMSISKLEEISKEIFSDETCGLVKRIKGFTKEVDGSYQAFNATKEHITKAPIEEGQEVVVVIGEQLKKDAIEKYFQKK